MADQSKGRVSRLLPGLTTEYSIVSMPAWAWPWLDTLVRECFPQGYRQFLVECAEYTDQDRPLEDILESFARLRREDHYRLTNDNEPTAANVNHTVAARPATRRRTMCFPKAVRLFRFMPFATTWDHVLIRRGWRP